LAMLAAQLRQELLVGDTRRQVQIARAGCGDFERERVFQLQGVDADRGGRLAPVVLQNRRLAESAADALDRDDPARAPSRECVRDAIREIAAVDRRQRDRESYAAGVLVSLVERGEQGGLNIG